MTARGPATLFGAAGMAVGFLTPVFQRRQSNYLWVQEIDDEDRVSGFQPISEHLNPQVEPLDFTHQRAIGDSTLYLYRNPHQLFGGTRLELSQPLRADFERLESRLHLRRSIAQFLGDDDLLLRATRDLERKQAPPAELELPSSPPWPGVIALPLFGQALELALRRANLVVTGAAGAGKTTLLRWLAEELRGRFGYAAVQLAYVPHTSLLQSLTYELPNVSAGRAMDAWLRARDELLGQSRTRPEAVQSLQAQFVGDVLREAFGQQSVTLILDDFGGIEGGDEQVWLIDAVSRLPGVNVIVSGRDHWVSPLADALVTRPDWAVLTVPKLSEPQAQSILFNWLEARGGGGIQEASKIARFAGEQPLSLLQLRHLLDAVERGEETGL